VTPQIATQGTPRVIMYSSVANQSFSFLLTMDEFRNMMNEGTRPSWVKITTITMLSKCMQEIDTHKLREAFGRLDHLCMRRDGHLDSEILWSLDEDNNFYNGITLKYEDTYSKKSIKIFPNGSVHVAGCRDLFDCQRVIAQLKCMFKHYLGLGDIIDSESFQIAMINSNFSLNYKVNLMKVAEHFRAYKNVFTVSFQPETYSAVKIKFKPFEDENKKPITASIFSTGKILITGAKTLKQVAYGYNIVCRHIDRCDDKIRVSPCEDKEVFDTYLGYKSSEFVQKLRSMGFKSWLQTTKDNECTF
jgi:TATA-box binding protein (TBP) (component of TFIID and TFIIIB)